VDLNKFIEIGHYYPIPHVQRTIQDKIQKYCVFLDIDMTNSFHQFRLGIKTRQFLSIQKTYWGQFEP
jgi:hypothetical protein